MSRTTRFPGRRGRGAFLTIAALAGGLGACGGEVRTGEPDPSRTNEGSPDASRSTAGGSAMSGSDEPDTVALPACPKGFKSGEAIGKLCVYTTNGLCYETKLDACACACTKQSGTVCSSGFPEVDGTTKVTCH